MKSKYPIVLVHGLGMKQSKYLKAFGQIDRFLRIAGYSVYVPSLDSFGPIESNAEMLKEEILKILEKEGVDKVNIIAHSKGGLDSKYMISELGMEEKVASLTTLCTPHKGSPLASNILKLPSFILFWINFWLNLYGRLLGDKHPDALKTGRQLSRLNSVEEETISFSNKVYCQSFSTVEKKGGNFLMNIPYSFSRYFEKDIPTDGMVPVDSAIWGNYRGMALSTHVGHNEIVDFFPNKKTQDQIYSFYIALCDELVSFGF